MLDRKESITTIATVRNDAFTFYALGISSFLESAVPEYVKNLCLLFEGDEQFIEWLTTEWMKEESVHGDLAKKYLERIWPEFQ